MDRIMFTLLEGMSFTSCDAAIDVAYARYIGDSAGTATLLSTEQTSCAADLAALPAPAGAT